MKFLMILFLTLLTSFAFANPPSSISIDSGCSGTLTASAALCTLNVQEYFKYGAQVNVTINSGSPTVVATLQGSNDGVTYQNMPIRSTGDATKSGSLSSSGALILEEDSVEVNFLRIYYSVPSGNVTISEIRKLHRALQ